MSNFIGKKAFPKKKLPQKEKHIDGKTDEHDFIGSSANSRGPMRFPIQIQSLSIQKKKIQILGKG